MPVTKKKGKGNVIAKAFLLRHRTRPKIWHHRKVANETCSVANKMSNLEHRVPWKEDRRRHQGAVDKKDVDIFSQLGEEREADREIRESSEKRKRPRQKEVWKGCRRAGGRGFPARIR